MPAISVVIPLFNKEPFVRRTLESVRAQTLPAHEVIIVDDGSTDGSVAELGALMPNERLITQKNAGEAAAREAGVLVASGEWIAFLDADDIWLPNHLEELAVTLRLCHLAELVGTSYIRATSQALDSVRMRTTGSRRAVRREIDYFSTAARNVGILCSSTVAAKRGVLLNRIPFPRASAGADLALWADIALRHRVAHSSVVTAVYVQGTGGVIDQMRTRSAGPNTSFPQGLYDLTPSCRVVAEWMLDGNSAVPGPMLHKYLNGRLFSSVKGCLIRGEWERARRLARLRDGASHLEHAVVLRLVSVLPPAVICTLYRAWRLTARVQRRVRCLAPLHVGGVSRGS